MRPSGPLILGGAIGLSAALLVLAHVSTGGRPPEQKMLGDAGGRIHSVVMQYVTGSDFVLPVYRQYLAQQSSDLRVYLVCPEEADFEAFKRGVGPVTCPVTPILAHHPMTAWSRDRWVALEPASGETWITLLFPRGEDLAAAWPQRAGDGRIADDLGSALPRLVAARRSGLLFDGGDYLADGGLVFVTPAVIARNLQHRVGSREQLCEAIAAEVGLTPVLLESAPDHHAGMFMMSAGAGADGKRRMVVGDPSLARGLYDAAGAEALELEGGADFSAQTQARFDFVARVAAGRGYHVTRIPAVAPVVGKNYLSYVNVILDARNGERIVYLPTFDGQPALNAAAEKIWQGLGYRVCPIDCSSVWTRGGTLHCLVNVLEREKE